MAATVLLHVIANVLAQHAGYGLFRDELYFIMCGRHLAWGYVDQPPVVALATRFSELVFGLHSLALFRLLPAIAGAAEVALTGLIAWELGGGVMAQALAMTGILLAPMALGIDGYVSMNCFEPIFWMTIAFAVLRMAHGGDKRWWLVVGVAGGLSLETKWNALFFFVELLAALLLSPQRKLLASRWFACCVVLISALALPNVIWEVRHDWPTLVWLHNEVVGGKNVILAPLPFFTSQIVAFGWVACLLWLGGVAWLLFGRGAKQVRFAGILYVLYLPLMVAMHAKDYYLAAIYPLYFAAGGVACELLLWRRWQRRVLLPLYAVLLVVGDVLALPVTLPVLRPVQYVRYAKWLHAKPQVTQTFDHSPLPQYLADMLGWHEMADKLAEAYWSLQPGERAKAVIFGDNYGEASAVNIYRPDVPPAISGHQNYFYWGPRGHDGSVVIVIGQKRADLEKEFNSVTEVAQTTNEWVEPYERRPIFICLGLHVDLRVLWPKVKYWY